MKKTVFKIAGMDCPAEENLVRMQLSGMGSIQTLDFDIPGRQMTVHHTGSPEKIASAIDHLDLGAELLYTGQAGGDMILENRWDQQKILRAVLIINFSFFVIEMATGLLSRSMGLVADSLDMLADSLVYGLSLFAVGGTAVLKKRIARMSGYFQMVLAGIGFAEVIRRFIMVDTLPEFRVMTGVAALALAANAACLYLLQRSKSREAHMRASMIFTSNDVIINLGVIAAGVLVCLLESNKPDLAVGAVVFVLVMHGAFRILKLGK